MLLKVLRLDLFDPIHLREGSKDCASKNEQSNFAVLRNVTSNRFLNNLAGKITLVVSYLTGTSS
jgi:hypothetical protein